jgi:DNA polymerase III delta subunit
LPEDILLVFVSLDPDKRLKLYKLLSTQATVKEFPMPTDAQLHTFLQQKLGQYYTREL